MMANLAKSMIGIWRITTNNYNKLVNIFNGFLLTIRLPKIVKKNTTGKKTTLFQKECIEKRAIRYPTKIKKHIRDKISTTISYNP